tara:strand:- start:670 stop:3525 length:2856 start_codon:yes stop_codon:yes gene_type:complete
MKSQELTEFFSLLGKAKKEKKEEFNNLLKEADINLDVLTSTVVSGIKEAKVNQKKQKKKEEKLIEQLDTLIDTIEKPKEVKDITEPAVTVGVPEDFDVSKLEEDPITVQDWNNGDDIKFTEIDAVDIIKPEPIKTPEVSDTVAQAIKFIEETNIKEEIENSDETSIENLKGEIKQVRDILYKVLAHGPGSGEVNLLKLDDVDEDTAKVDGKFLKYESSSGKFVGADASGGGAGIGTNGSVDTVGIITAAQFSGFSHLIAPYASTKTITVKVASKVDGEHRYYGTGSGSAYILDNVQSPFLTLTPGRTYRFDVSDSSNSGHPFRFYLDAAKATAYTTGVTVGSGYVDLEVTDSTPTVLHYQCSSHGYMGNAVQISSSNAIKLNSQAASYYLDYDNFTNTPTIPTNNNQLTNGAGYTTFDGAYSSLSGRPTIPTNNNQLTNGAGFITTSFTNTNQLTNGAGFITASDDITGNSASATILENARTIGGVSFNGSANIDLPGVNSAGNQNTTGTSAGLTGTPSITVNAVNAATGTFSGNVTIGGTLTYEDVTNIDSVGLVTARSGLIVGTGVTLSKDGDGFFTGVTTATTFVGNLTGNVTGSASQLNGQAASYYLDYGNFSNTPTIPTNNNQLTNGAGFITTSFTNTNQLTNGAGFIDGSALNASNLSSGTVPDARFPSALPAIDGSALTGIAVTDNIRTNTNATFLQNVNVSGTTTATTFIGNLTGNVTGNVSGTSGSTTGNAATATRLATSRTIGGVGFDGSASINLPGVNSAGNQDTTGNAATSTLAVSSQGLTGSPNITVTDVNAVDAIISGNLSVAGTITSLDQNDILATGIITASSGVDLGDPGIITLSSDTLTTTSSSADTVASVSATVNRSATFQVQVTRGTEYHVTTINVVHDGTNAFLSEYGTIRTGSILATFDADISGGNLRLRVTPTSTTSTVFKLSKTVIKV